jgi:hypothetical protein
MTKYLDENENYFILDEIYLHRCCDEQQFIHVCRVCGETMGCYYCEFDSYGPHGCDTV